MVTVCQRCGLEAVFNSTREKFFHVEEPSDKSWEPHDVLEVVTRQEYLYGQATAPAKKGPTERQADALERIATALEGVVQRLDS